ncbi:PLP-dependent aminotransferase family protein [Microbaculum marinum]|uniref:PLP-dependent aminotransferase family protein n=1 Tax=Microbaculum marinum TaxID=1764581 RepID=A0AAW9RFX8_9HYPH
MTDYRAIADRLADDIRSGRLAVGERLPPQREFAYRNEIAVSTASRVYAELGRRGLVSGEVGRGTFVSGPEPSLAGVPLYETRHDRIDLELNYSVLPEVPGLVAPAMESLLDPRALEAALQPSAISGSGEIRQDAARIMAIGGWTPDPEGLAISGNGRQAIAAALSAVAPAGERIGIERMTYPVAKVKMARLGLRAVPLAMDAHGIVPEAVEEAHRSAPLRAIYLQPTLHNPLGVTMPAGRRAELAAVLEKHDIVAIEDAVYAFLHDAAPAPLAAHAPDRTLYVDSLSKRVAPGLTLGFLHAPAGPLREAVSTAVRAGGWRPQTYGLMAAGRLMREDIVDRLAVLRRRDAAARQVLARDRLAGFEVHGDPRAYHLWLELPEGWRADTFVAAASRRGVAVMPAAAFAAGQGHAPNAVRLALASPPMETLAAGLDIVAAVARSAPDDNIVQ